MLIAGVDIGGTSVKLGIVDETNALVAMHAIPSVHGDPSAMVAAIAKALEAFALPFEAVGVATAGRVDRLDGTVTASNLGWANVPLETLLRDALGVPVAVDNDAQAALVSEWQTGVCKGVSDVVYLTLGTGIGGAFIVSGRPARGYGNTGGEVGHMITHAGGLPCPCGQRGCFERYAAARVLQEMANAEGISIQRLFADAEAGKPRAAQRVDDYLAELCYGLLSLFRIFAPQMVVIGGGLSNLGEPFAERLKRTLKAHTEPIHRFRMPEIRLAESRNDAGILGGAAIARYAGAGER